MVLTYIAKNQCPRCHQGHVFQNSNLFSFKSGIMNQECPVCHLDFNKEPGFYWGSMYVSYGLTIVEVVIAYTICRLLGTGPHVSINLWIMLGVIVLASPFNFRMARLVWLYIFPKN